MACGQGTGESTARGNGQQASAVPFPAWNVSCTKMVSGMWQWSSSQKDLRGRGRQRDTSNKPGEIQARGPDIKTWQGIPFSQVKNGNHIQGYDLDIAKCLWSNGKLTYTQSLRGSLYSGEWMYNQMSYLVLLAHAHSWTNTSGIRNSLTVQGDTCHPHVCNHLVGPKGNVSAHASHGQAHMTYGSLETEAASAASSNSRSSSKSLISKECTSSRVSSTSCVSVRASILPGTTGTYTPG